MEVVLGMNDGLAADVVMEAVQVAVIHYAAHRSAQ
jgi:hypothetical protein